jgi:hypothetical protein
MTLLSRVRLDVCLRKALSMLAAHGIAVDIVGGLLAPVSEHEATDVAIAGLRSKASSFTACVVAACLAGLICVAFIVAHVGYQFGGGSGIACIMLCAGSSLLESILATVATTPMALFRLVATVLAVPSRGCRGT